MAVRDSEGKFINTSGSENPFYGKHHSEEVKEKNRIAHLGKKQSRETIEKRIKTIRERYNGGWHKTTNGGPSWNSGITCSDKTKKKISKSMKKKWNDPEFREKSVKSAKKKTLSEKHKQNISKGLSKAYVEGRRESTRKIGFYSGSFYSKKNGKTLEYRSSYEWFAYQLLEQMVMVFAYEVEPFTIKYRKGYNKVGRYTPDILVTYMDGSKQLIEVKPKKKVNDEMVQKKMKAAKRYCKKNGIEFSMWTEDQVFKRDIRKPAKIILREPVWVQ